MRGLIAIEIVLYTTGCPRCKVLERKLNDLGLNYNVCADIEEMKTLGFRGAPMLGVDNKFMDFVEAVMWLDSGEVNAT